MKLFFTLGALFVLMASPAIGLATPRWPSMPANANVTADEAQTLAAWILGQQ